MNCDSLDFLSTWLVLMRWPSSLITTLFRVSPLSRADVLSINGSVFTLSFVAKFITGISHTFSQLRRHYLRTTAPDFVTETLKIKWDILFNGMNISCEIRIYFKILFSHVDKNLWKPSNWLTALFCSSWSNVCSILSELGFFLTSLLLVSLRQLLPEN